MRLTGRILIGALVVGLACGDEGPPPPVPTGMTLTGGNNQAGLPGTPLPLPLTVTVLGAGGAPYPNARVTWTVVQGSAAVGSPVDTSDVNGASSTTVTIGTVPGNITVAASVTGVSAVQFQVTALNPCVNRMVVPTDTTVNGVLTNFDCAVALAGESYFTDFYSLTLAGQTSLQISMNAAVFNTWVDQFHANGAFIAFNNDIDSTGTNTNTRYNLIAGTGVYYIGASTFLPTRTGAYSFVIAPRAQTLTGCSDDLHRTWITRGVTITEQIEATDCVTTRPTGGGRAFSDKVMIVLTPARFLDATLTSGAFNPRLELWEVVPPTGQPVFRTAVDGVAGTASLTFAPPSPGGHFRLEMTSVDTVQAGAYTLTVTGPAPNMVASGGLRADLPLPGPRQATAKRGVR